MFRIKEIILLDNWGLSNLLVGVHHKIKQGKIYLAKIIKDHLVNLKD